MGGINFDGTSDGDIGWEDDSWLDQVIPDVDPTGGESGDQIARELAPRQWKPGTYTLFLKRIDQGEAKLTQCFDGDGEFQQYNAPSLVLTFANAEDPDQTVRAFLKLPPTDPEELEWYSKGRGARKSPSGSWEPTKSIGWHAKTYKYLVSRLGLTEMSGNKEVISKTSRSIRNWFHHDDPEKTPRYVRGRVTNQENGGRMYPNIDIFSLERVPFGSFRPKADARPASIPEEYDV